MRFNLAAALATTLVLLTQSSPTRAAQIVESDYVEGVTGNEQNQALLLFRKGYRIECQDICRSNFYW